MRRARDLAGEFALGLLMSRPEKQPAPDGLGGLRGELRAEIRGYAAALAYLQCYQYLFFDRLTRPSQPSCS